MRSKHLSDLRRGLVANVITTTLKFGDRLAFEFFQRFLARQHRLDWKCLSAIALLYVRKIHISKEIEDHTRRYMVE